MNDVTVYDLGSVDVQPQERVATQGAPTPKPRHAERPLQATTSRPGPTVARPRTPAPPRPAVDLASSLNLFVPGAERLVRGDLAAGVAILATLGLSAALGWAIVQTIGRLTATFELFGISRAAVLWSLAGVYGLAAVTHVVAILRAEPADARPPHPVAAGIASGIVPGWGQILNGDRGRAALFVTLVWLCGAAWLLASPLVTGMLEAYGLFLPPPVAIAASAGVRWTVLAVVWSIAVYDAAQRASFRRTHEAY